MRNLLLSGMMPSAPARKIPSAKFGWLGWLRMSGAISELGGMSIVLQLATAVSFRWWAV